MYFFASDERERSLHFNKLYYDKDLHQNKTSPTHPERKLVTPTKQKTYKHSSHWCPVLLKGSVDPPDQLSNSSSEDSWFNPIAWRDDTINYWLWHSFKCRGLAPIGNDRNATGDSNKQRSRTQTFQCNAYERCWWKRYWAALIPGRRWRSDGRSDIQREENYNRNSIKALWRTIDR